MRSAGSLLHKTIRKRSIRSDLSDALLSDPNSHRPLWCLGNTGPTLGGAHGLAHVHFDPFRLYAQSRGLDHWSLFYNEHGDSPRLTETLIGPNKGILGELLSPDISLWRTPVIHRKLSQETVFFDRFRSLHRDIPSLIANCVGTIARTLAYRNAFRRVFETRRPRVLLCFNYYQRIGWALCAAAREANIPLYDIQHGAQGRFHHAYHWASTPAGGWNTTPQGYLLYGVPRDAEAGHGDCHIGAPSWYLWCKLAFSPDESIPVPANWKRNAEALLQDARHFWAEAERRSSPWLMYASFPDERPGRIERIEARLENRARILMKRHPTKIYGDPAPLERLPLPCGLAAMDGLVSGYSATILEAAFLDLPSYVMSGNAEMFYRGLPLRPLPADDDLAAADLARTVRCERKPEVRLRSALDATKWPEGWI